MKDQVTKEVLERVDVVGGKIDTLINSLAEKMGVGVEHFWPIFIKQQYIEGLVTLISVITFLILITIITIVIYKHKDKLKETFDKETPGVIICVFITMFLVSSGIFIIEAGDIFSQIFNPEYHAIRSIIDMVN